MSILNTTRRHIKLYLLIIRVLRIAVCRRRVAAYKGVRVCETFLTKKFEKFSTVGAKKKNK